MTDGLPRAAKHDQQQELAKADKKTHPTCKSKWSKSNGKRFSCSGGRVPRNYTAAWEGAKERCACIDPDKVDVPPGATFAVYTGCDPAADLCFIRNTCGSKAKGPCENDPPV